MTESTNKAAIAADHLIGNLYFNLDALPLIAGALSPDVVRYAVGGNAAVAYSEMCRLLRGNERLSAGGLEAGLRALGFDFDWLAKLQKRVTVEGLPTLHNYAAEIVNHAELLKVQQYSQEAIASAQADGAKAITVKGELLAKLAADQQTVESVEHTSAIGKRVREQLREVKNGKLWGASTGFKSLNQLFLLVDGELIVVAARPSQGKCLGKGTKVIMLDGSLRNVEDVKVGDRLMGPDSKPKTVLTLGRGREMMYWIHQSYGISYRVNENHILSLKRSKNEYLQCHGMIKNISVKDALPNLPYIKSRFKGYKSAVEFEPKPLAIDPYFIGLWLGDGTSCNAKIWNTDPEIIEYLNQYAAERQSYVAVNDRNRTCQSYLITAGRTQASRDSSIHAQLRHLGLFDNKHIPPQYLINSTENRLQLLAGLLDSDGYYAGNYDNGRTAGNYFEITQKNKNLAEQIKFLCDSLGFRTSLRAKKATITDRGYESIVYRVRLAGDLERIPTKVERKKARPWDDFRDWTMSGIDIVPDKIDDYYGFELDGDGLFLLEDFTVTHNTSLARMMFYYRALEIAKNDEKGQVVFFSSDDTSDKFVLDLACTMAQVDSNKIRGNRASKEEWTRFEHEMTIIESIPLYIDDTPRPTVEHMYYKCAMLSAQKPVRLAGQDYASLIRVDDARGERQEAERAFSGVKGIGNTLRFPWVQLSQVRKDVEARADKWPTPSDLMYAGEAEANVCLMIMRPEHYINRGEDVDCEDKYKKGVALVNVGKNKSGRIGVVPMVFRAEYARFDDMALTPPPTGSYPIVIPAQS